MKEISEIEIKAMSKEQNYLSGYADGRSDMLDQIRAEIQAMADIEWNTQVGSISQGLEDAIEIIDKYKL